MPDARQYRNGTVAVYQGDLYSAGGSPEIRPWITLIREADDPIPEGLKPHPRAPDRVFYVRIDQLDAWYTSSWTFRWRGEPFWMSGASGDRISGGYKGGNGAFADEYLTRTGGAEYQGVFPLEEVTDLVEKRVDLLEEWRREQREGDQQT